MWIGRIDAAKATLTERTDWFPGGPVHQQNLVEPVDEGQLSALSVSFAAGARTRPHVHPVDQLLFVVDGVGIVATGEEKRYIQSGDWVRIPAGTWHWHGATPQDAMTHVSIKPFGPTDWESEWRDWETYAEGAQQLSPPRD
jgi:quercetin dioxygenase-like cupin family protein